MNIAFYYLLRVGEYTKQQGSKKKRTVAFRLSDITLRDCKGKPIPHTAPLSTLLQATEATLRITNQKNGVKGQCIHNECTGDNGSPVKSLARRIFHIRSHGGDATSPLYTYFSDSSTQPKYIDQREINTAIKEAAAAIGLFDLGYEKGDVSSHSLRAGGAMAMHLNGLSTETIKKQGRWKSDTFLMYIHEQISAFASGVSVKMSTVIPFRHIAGPNLLPPS